MKLHFRYLLTLLYVTFFISGTFAQFVNSERAKNVAVALFNERKPYQTPVVSVEDIQNSKLVYHNEVPTYYIFDMPGQSFAIISADERILPVLGYSFESDFDENNVPDGMGWLFQEYKQQIYDVVVNNLINKEVDTKQEWEKYERATTLQKSYGASAQLPSPQSVGPLMTTTWSQGCYYNESCPADNTLGSTRCGRVPTGCVAVAFAQVLKYHNYPTQGSGSKSYSSNYGTLTANFGTTTYNWANMPNKLLSNNSDVAQLLFHTGVAVNMTYTANSSSAYTTNIKTALTSRFKYASTVQNITKSSYNNTQWDNVVKNELNAQRVVIISGHDPNANAGHAFVADGYQGTNSFHINWGWNGSSDGYFLLTALSPSSYAFNSNVGAIIGIKPLSTPVCQPVTGLTSSNITATGAKLNWTAGSGSSNYNVKYKPTTGSTWTTLSATTNSKTITGLAPATTYEFQVQRVCSSTSTSAYSNSVTFTTAAPVSTGNIVTIGTGTANNGGAPYGTGNSDERVQIIITQSELVAAGYTNANNYIRSLAFNVASASSQTMKDFTIKIGHTSTASFSSSAFLNVNTTTVFSGDISVSSGWKTHTFTTPFLYNGSSNIIIEICWNNTSATSNSTVKISNTSSYRTLFYKANKPNGGVCSNNSGTRTYSRPNIKLSFSATATGGVGATDYNNTPKSLTTDEENSDSENESITEEQIISVNLYPNPAQYTATIEINTNETAITQGQITVFDITGKQVFSDNISGNTYELRLDTFNNGLYQVMIVAENKYFTQKLIVRKQ